MRRNTIPWFPIVYWGIVLILLTSFLLSISKVRSNAPPGARYEYAAGHLGDFYDYGYMIRRGQEGHILYKNVYYVEEQTPEVFLHPFYHMLGYISRPFFLTPGRVFFVSKLAVWIALFGSVYLLLQKALHTQGTRILGGILFLSATSCWDVATWIRDGVVHAPQTWNDYFDIFKRICNVPPHHIIAFACLAWIVMAIGSKTMHRSTFITGLMFAVVIGLVQPFLSFFLMMMVGVHFGISVLSLRRFPKQGTFLLAIIGMSGVMIVFNMYILQYALHAVSISSTWNTPRYITLETYLRALGPLMGMSLLVFFHKTYLSKPIIKLLILWAWIPFVLFLLPEISNVTSTYRLLQTYQQLPFAILAAAGIGGTIWKFTWKRIILVVLAVGALLYGFVPYRTSLYQFIRSVHPEYFNYYISKDLTNTFTFLKHETPKESVVLAGVALSNMIPAFTHNRVLIGHDSTTPPSQKTIDAMDFYQGFMNLHEVKTFISRYHIAYIIFGIDAPAWENTPYVSFSFLHPVYRSGTIQVIQTE